MLRAIQGGPARHAAVARLEAGKEGPLGLQEARRVLGAEKQHRPSEDRHEQEARATVAPDGGRCRAGRQSEGDCPRPFPLGSLDPPVPHLLPPVPTPGRPSRLVGTQRDVVQQGGRAQAPCHRRGVQPELRCCPRPPQRPRRRLLQRPHPLGAPRPHPPGL